MIGLFKQKTPANIIFLFVIGILVKLPVFMNARVPVIRDEDTFVYRELVMFLESITKNDGLLFAVITYLLLFTQCLQLNRLINNNRMMQRMNYLPGLAYLLITSLMPEWNYFSAPLLVNTLVLFIFSGLFTIYNQFSIKGSIFNIGLLVGLSSYLFFQSLILLIWLILALMVLRNIRFNEWLICILGVTTPYYFYAAYLVITNNWSWTKIFKPLYFTVPEFGQSFWLAVSSFLLIIPFLIGGYFVQENLRKMLIQVRKNWSLMLIYLLFALFIPFLNNYTDNFENWVLICIPFAAFHSFTYLYPSQRWLPALIFWIMILFIIVYQFKGPGWLG